MDKDETELNGPSKRIRVAWILIPLCILGAGALTFTTRFKNVTKTKHEFRQAFAAHDWKRLAEILPPIDLQGGTLPPDRFAAFLDQYVGKTEKLVISEKEYVGQTGIEVLYAEGPQVSKGNHNDSQIMEVLVVPDKNRIPFFPPVPRIKYDFTMTYVAVAIHAFPGTDRFRPSPRSSIYGPPQYLFALREKGNLERMRVPPYWSGSLAPKEWDRFISSLRAGLVHDGWDVKALLKAYKLTDSDAPAKDSRRP